MLEGLRIETPPFLADPSERLFAPAEPPSRDAKGRFRLLLALCFLLHVLLLALLLDRDWSEPVAVPPEQEIPIEVIVEPPPPPPEEKLQPPPAPPPPPQPQKLQKAEKPAFDAPRAPNNEKIERDAPDKETKAPTPPGPPEQAAPKPAQEKTPDIAREPIPKEEPSAQQPQADDKPEAEALDRAALQKEADKQKKKTDPVRTKTPPPEDQKAAVARQLSAYAPIPDYQFGSAAKPAPVTGGNEKTTYLSILYGLIMRRLQEPSATRPGGGTVIVGFWLDDKGNLTHQAVYKSSGFPDIDAETLAAVRRAAPFPEPPRDQPHGFLFQREVPVRTR
jgi:protein TonB